MNYWLLSASSVILFLVSASLNIDGYIHLFPNSVYMAGTILAGLELAKFTIVGVVYNIEHHISTFVKVILSAFLGLLILISVIGHYAILTSFYTSNQSSSIIIKDNTAFYKNRMEEIKTEIADLQALYKNYPKGYASKRLKVYNSVRPQIDELQSEYKELFAKLSKEREKGHTELKNNSNIFEASAKLMGVTTDKFALYIIMLVSLILDPLALLMVYTAHSFKSNFQKAEEKNLNIDTIEVQKETPLPNLEEKTQDKVLESNEVDGVNNEVRDIQNSKNSLYQKLIDIQNIKLYGSTVRDVMSWNDYEVKSYKASFLKTKLDRYWFKLALVWREVGTIDNGVMVLDESVVDTINPNEIYGRF